MAPHDPHRTLSTDAPRRAGNAPLAVLRTPGVPRVLAGSLLGRLPSGMAPLALLLFARGNGRSIALAGVLAAVYAGASAVGAPPLARAADRYRQPPVLLGAAAASTVGFLLVAATGQRPLLLAVLGTALAGLGAPPLESCLRALWTRFLPPAMLPAGYSLDVASQELIFVTGPVLAVAAVAAAGPAAGLLLAAALQLGGTALFATSAASARWRGEPAVRHWAGPLRNGPLRLLLAATVFVGLAVGSLTVAVTPYAEHAATRSWAGWLLAVQAVGALGGGVAYGAFSTARPAADPRRRLPLLAALLAVGYLPLLVVPPIGGMVPLALLSGVMLPPLLTVVFLTVDRLAPAGTVTEAFAWVATVFSVGYSLGAAVDGVAVEAFGIRAGFALAPVAAALVVVPYALVRSR